MEAKQRIDNAVVPTACKDGRERIRTILAMALDAFVAVDAEGLITDWNLQAESTFGWPQALAIGRPLAAWIVPPDQRDAFEQTVQNFLASQAGSAQNQRIEITALHRDGRVFPIELSMFSTTLGEACRMAAFARIPDSSKHMDEEAEERHQAIMDQLGEAYIEVDLRGRYTFLNKTYREVYFPWSARAHLGASYKAIFTPEHAQMFRETYHNVYLTGEPARLEYSTTRPDGKTVFIEQSVSLRKDPQGNPIGFMIIARDSTRRKEGEIELAKAKEAAETASRAKSEFLANMSHEIRTPLNGVIGMVELANSTDLTPDQRDLLGMAQESANSLLGVIKDILDFSKIEAGELEFEHTEFDLAKTVAEVMRSMAIRAHQKTLALACELSPQVPRLVLGDGARLKQVLSNLVGNAVKFTAQGKVMLRVESIEAPAGAKDQVRLKFSVSDTGVGIPQEKQKRIFEAFSQADASTTRNYGGTGLGLTICLRIVKLMGGEIWVESDSNQGSVFHFTAAFGQGSGQEPCFTAQSQAELAILCSQPSLAAANVTPAAVPPRARASEALNILVAEDNLVNQKLALRLLEKLGHCVVLADNGKEALVRLQEQSFDLVLMDVQMPEMDGFSATAAIRQKEQNTHAHLPIVAMTAHAMTGDREHCLRAGMDDYIAKPVNLTELNQIIGRVMQAHTVKELERQVAMPATDLPGFPVRRAGR
ncbi:MAG TPA: ATP-binding protein [Candidatus Angelobacter sp.]|nr:ATP-binding protein [Candidatus Angelobacter sp.]